jgi:hypothetical protein
MSSSCSIHLGNYIMVVQPPTPRKPEPGSAIPPQQSTVSPDRKKKGGKQGPAEPKPISMKQITAVGHDMGALDFELAWLRFLREAEDDYQRRLCRVSHYSTRAGVHFYFVFNLALYITGQS